MMAYRWYQLDEDAVLTSPCQEIPLDGRACEATDCMHGHDHPPPHPGCGCGVYGVLSLPGALAALNYPYAQVDVVATVTLAGPVLPDASRPEEWVRARALELVELVVVARRASWARNLEARYGVPTYVLPHSATGPLAATQVYRPPGSRFEPGMPSPLVTPTVAPLGRTKLLPGLDGGRAKRGRELSQFWWQPQADDEDTWLGPDGTMQYRTSRPQPAPSAIGMPTSPAGGWG
jgi:hypothetical protein